MYCFQLENAAKEKSNIIFAWYLERTATGFLIYTLTKRIYIAMVKKMKSTHKDDEVKVIFFQQALLKY